LRKSGLPQPPATFSTYILKKDHELKLRGSLLWTKPVFKNLMILDESNKIPEGVPPHPVFLQKLVIIQQEWNEVICFTFLLKVF
jgi:hypothetical protein